MPTPHPFFDADVFPFEREDAREFYQALYTAVGLPNRIDIFYRGSGSGLPPINLQQAADGVWREALGALTTARCLRVLCDLLISDASITAIHDRINAVINAKSAASEVVFSPDIVFVNRVALRDHLKRLSAPAAMPSVLLVRGDPRSGNSWTEHLVRAVARDYGARLTYIYDGSVFTVADVAKQLFTLVGHPEHVEPGDTSDPAWYMNIVRRLWGFAQQSERVYWIVVDDLAGSPEEPRLDPEIRRFFDQFVLMMRDSAMANWFRLVLINYPTGTVPTKWRDEVWVEDRPSIAEVNKEAVATFLLGAAAARGKQMSTSEARRAAGAVFREVAAAAPPERLRAIKAEIERRVQKL